LPLFLIFLEGWLKSAREKKPKKSDNPDKIAKLKLTRIGDASASALVAAGVNLGRQYSWANATTSQPGLLCYSICRNSRKVYLVISCEFCLIPFFKC